VALFASSRHKKLSKINHGDERRDTTKGDPVKIAFTQAIHFILGPTVKRRAEEKFLS
jgi:hypothetical protein